MMPSLEKLPPGVRALVVDFPVPAGKIIAVVYDRSGAILHYTPSSVFPFHDGIIEKTPLKIFDFARPFFTHGDPPAGFRDRLFQTTEKGDLTCLLDSQRFHSHASPYSICNTTPCLVRIREMEGCFVAGFFPLSTFLDKVIGNVSMDIIVVLGPEDEILFFNDRFGTLLDDENDGKKIRLPDLMDGRLWDRLVGREREIREYYAGLVSAAAPPWAPLFEGEMESPADWLSETLHPWRLGGGEFQTDPVGCNAFVTFSGEVEQVKCDVRLEWQADLSRAASLGVVFHANIYKSQSRFSTPDENGYSFTVTRLDGAAREVQVILKKAGKVVQSVSAALGPVLKAGSAAPRDLSMAFEKMGGVFFFYAEGKKQATLYDLDPITENKHAFVGLVGGAGTRIKGVRLRTRPSAFDPRRIPKDSIDFQFYRMPGHIFEAKLHTLSIMEATLRCVYMKDVTHSRRLLARVNSYVKEIDQELETARKIQALLADLKAPDSAAFRMTYFYQSSGHVGGDLLDVKPLGDGKFGLLIYDVSGHGIAASLISAMAKMSFDSAFRENPAPAAVARRVNADICAVIDPSIFLTAFIALLDLKAGTLTYVRAGHSFPILLPKEGPPKFLEPGNLMIGYLVGQPFDTFVEKVGPGDRLFLYTDGIIEARNPDRKFFGKNQLAETLSRSRGRPLEEAKKNLLDSVRSFVRGRPFDDDVTFILADILAVGPGAL